MRKSLVGVIGGAVITGIGYGVYRGVKALKQRAALKVIINNNVQHNEEQNNQPEE